jgi:hypothetical protein
MSCVHSYVSGTGKNRTRWEHLLRQERQSATASTDGYMSYIPVEFKIPYDAKETDTRNPEDEILWKLASRSKLPGLDFNSTFIAPVFKTTGSDAKLTTASLEAHDESLMSGSKPSESKIVTGTTPRGGFLFYFAPARNMRMAMMLTIFGMIFLAGGLFFGYAAGQIYWFLGLMPGVVSGGVGSLLLAFSLWLWFGSTTIEVLDRALHIRSSFFGIARSRMVPASNIQDFGMETSMQAGDQVWYDLKLKLSSGRSVTACSGLEKKDAEWMITELKKDLGVENSSAPQTSA